MRKLVEKIIAKLKKDPMYKLDDNYSTRELVTIVWHRAIPLMRGGWKKIFIKSKGFLFCGRNVVIEHAYNVRCGKSCIIEDGVKMNALSHNGIILGDNVTVAKDSIFVCTGVVANKGVGIIIGSRSAVGAQSFLGGQGGVEIGSDVIMGPGVKIFSENHLFSHPEIPIRKQGESRLGVSIGNNCWIGAGSIILDGVKIGSGCVVAAGSVVTSSIAENSVVAGVPARIIKKRIE